MPGLAKDWVGASVQFVEPHYSLTTLRTNKAHLLAVMSACVFMGSNARRKAETLSERFEV